MYEPDKFFQLLQALSWSKDVSSDFSPEFSSFITTSNDDELGYYLYLLEEKCQQDHTLAYKFVNYIFSHLRTQNFGEPFDGAVVFAIRQAAQEKQEQYATNLLQKLMELRYPSLNITLPDISTIYDPMQFSKEPFITAKGSSSAVSLSKPDPNNNMIYALKYFVFLPGTTMYDFYALEMIFRETIILKFLNAKNNQHIIQLYETYLSSPRMLMKMPYANVGGLDQQLEKNLPTINLHHLDFIKQILDGLIFIHEQGVVHRDIKPQNIVLFSDTSGKDVLKIIDFGAAKFKKDLSLRDTCMTTPYYASLESLSPEMLESDRSDVFSAIMVLFMMIQNFKAPHPFSDHPNKELLSHIAKKPEDSDCILQHFHKPTTLLPSFEKTVADAKLKELMTTALLAPPEKRPTAKEFKLSLTGC
ncbi:MAG: protein kinase [Legionellales bacterium]|jgi:serine/threonine protein kinase